MKSINFPKMLNTTSTSLISDRDATASNLKLLLASERGEFTYDPDFGTKIKRYFFEQNNNVLKDIIIDEIYTKIAMFMPQLVVTRSDIKITQTRGKLSASIKALNRVDYKTNMYDLVLFINDVEES